MAPRHIQTFLAASLILHQALLPCPVQGADPALQKRLKVAIVFALTGEAAYWSEMQRKGAELARDDLNRDGANIELIIEDSGTTTAGSVSAFNKVVSVDKVNAVIGNIWSILTEPLKPLAEQKKILLVSPEPTCDESSRFVFSGGTHMEGLTEPFLKFFHNFPEVRRTALFTFDDPGWGNRNRDAWRDAAQQSGVSIVGLVESADLNADYRAIMVPLLRNKPDAVFVAHNPVGSIKAMALLRYKGKIFQSNALMETALNKQLAKQDLEGVYFADTLPDQDFRTRFEQKYKQAPVLEAHTGYEILTSIWKAYQNNPTDLAAGMRSVKYHGRAGEIDYTHSCAGNQAKWHLFQMRDGIPTLVE